VYPARGLKNFISAASILRLFKAVKVQFSDPETSVNKYQPTQQSNPEERQPHLYKGGSLKSRINPLKTKRTPLYLKTQVVPRSKHLSSRL
jgi:hypothetical protein